MFSPISTFYLISLNIQTVFSQFDFLNKSKETIQTIYENWRKYKVRVPVFGAILLDETLEKVSN